MIEPEDEDLREISRRATDRALEEFPRNDFNIRMRIAIITVVILVIANTVNNIYNSITLRKEVDCNQGLATALAQVGDQNRSITKRVIDKALSREGVDPKARAALRKQYDREFARNSKKRKVVLQLTCQSNSDTPSVTSTTVPSSHT